MYLNVSSTLQKPDDGPYRVKTCSLVLIIRYYKVVFDRIKYYEYIKVLLASNGMEIQVQGQNGTQAGRLVGRNHSVYSIPTTHAKLEGKSQLSFLMSASARPVNWDDMHYNVLPKTPCRVLHNAVF
jgi:hypothetical protein